MCSGGRGDARWIGAGVGGAMSLDELNPWHFAEPLAALLAARRERRMVREREVVEYLREVGRKCDVLVVEGAGGLLSPLGENFDARELIVALRARPVVVCPNRLGAVSQVRLVLAALGPASRRRAVVVLMSGRRRAAIQKLNRKLLGEFHPPGQIQEIPWIGKNRPMRELGPVMDAIVQTVEL